MKTAADRVLSRREFLGVAAAAGGFGAASVLSGCGRVGVPSAGTASAATPATSTLVPTIIAAKNSVFPTYVAATNGPKADLASDGPDYEAAFTYYPTTRVKSWSKEPPGAGGPFTVVNSFGAAIAATPREQNPAWQEVESQLNAQMQSTSTLRDPGKLAAIMASGDLPDVFVWYGGLNGTPNLAQFLQQSMADLTPYLAGDAVKDYSNLAALPTYAWRNAGCSYNGKLYMWPTSRYRPQNLVLRDMNIYDAEIGAGYVPKNADDLKRVISQLNKPDRPAWGGLGIGSDVPFFASMFGAPNGWQIDSSGKLLKDRETPQYREAVAYARDLVASGLTHPDAYTGALGSDSSAILKARTVLTGAVFGVVWQDLWIKSLALSPAPKWVPLPPFAGHDGEKPVHFMYQGYTTTSAINKNASPDRIRELLRIIDWLAAPFGSTEDLLLTYGVPDIDYTLNTEGHIAPTARSAADALGPDWRYIAQHPPVINLAGSPELTRYSYDFEHVALPVGIEDPTWGHYSPTFSSKGSILEMAFSDGLGGIVRGQRPLADYDQLVKDWQSGGGDKIRAEFQSSIAGS
jgi:putative aldouronate transport system substrate-binding protein